jgi:tetratricopeptide (TPR) repeat protein
MHAELLRRACGWYRCELRGMMPKRQAVALVVALACSAIFVAHKFGNAFVYDDLFVVNGGMIHDPGRIPELFAAHALIAQGEVPPMAMDTYRPISVLTFFWDAWLSGREPWSYHLTNLLLHLAAVACVFGLARRLLPEASPWTTASAALFFGLSPQLAEGHVWINGRSDPLTTLFGLLALLVWSGGSAPAPSARRSAAAGALFFCGLLCKEVLLFATPALVFWPAVRPRSAVARARSVLPFAIAAGLYLALRSWALQGLHAAGKPGHLRDALENLPVLWADGLRELLAPSRLYLRSMRDEYGSLGFGQRALIGLAVLACVALVLGVRRRLPVFSWSLAWFACTLAPSAMISVLLWPGFGRYLYLPCAGLAVGLGELLHRAEAALARRFADQPARARWTLRGSRVVVATYLIALGAQLATVTDSYADNRALYLSAAKVAPRPAYAFGFYGGARAKSGDHAGAIAPLTEAVRLDPREPAYTYQLAESQLLSGHPEQAEPLLRSAIARAPAAESGDLRVLLVKTLADRSPSAAVAELCQCLHHAPRHPDCLGVPRWLLDPRGPRLTEYRAAFARFGETCASARARAALAQVLAAR